MKKIISSALICILFLMQFTLISSASYSEEKIFSEQKDLSFSKTAYTNLSYRQIAKNKLEQLNMPENLWKGLPEDSLQLIAESNRIISSISYYTEDIENEKIVPMVKSDYKKSVQWHKESLNNFLASLKSKDSIIKTNSSYPITIPSPGITKDLNGGKLILVILLIDRGGGSYLPLGISQWQVMPTLRLHDVIGLSRGEGTAVVPQSAYGYYSYTYIDDPFGNPKEDTKNEEFLFEDLEASKNGYAFEFDMYPNISSSWYDQSKNEWKLYISRIQTEASCSLRYEGEVDNPNITKINHWLTYAHKVLTMGTTGIDFSIPFNVGFSVNFTAKYEQVYEEHLWRR